MGSVSRRFVRTTLVMAALSVLAATVAGCDARSAPSSMFLAETPQARAIQDLGIVLGVVALLVVLAVNATVIIAVVRGRRKAADTVRQVHGNTTLEVAWTTITAVVFFVILGFTVKTLIEVTADPAAAAVVQTSFPGDTVVLRSTGARWWWAFEYPQINLVTANEVYVPTEKPIMIEVRSADVIHSFWVPRLAGKMDMIPGRSNYLTFVAVTPGEYRGVCAEFCGAEHARMAFRIVAVSVADFSAWAKAQQAPAVEPRTDQERGGRAVFGGQCAQCHTIRGTPAAGKLGPDLTHFGSREALAAETLPNNPENLARWLKDPQEVKPANLMPNLGLSPTMVEQLTAYLISLK
jgi:cytochrome c oxidase subunit 2